MMRLAVALGGTDRGMSGIGVYVRSVLPHLAARLAATRISSSVASGLPTRRLSASERLNSSASWNTTPMFRRSARARTCCSCRRPTGA